MTEVRILPLLSSKLIGLENELPQENGSENALRQLYDNVAESWARDEKLLRDDLISEDIIIELSRTCGGSRLILELGCGDGHLCRKLSPIASNIVGIDSSRKMIEVARKRSNAFPNISYHQCDFRKLDELQLKAGFDLVLAIFAFCCVKSKLEIVKVLAQAHRLMSNGCALIVQVPHPLDPFLAVPSEWYVDDVQINDYFSEGQRVLRELRTVSGLKLKVGRYHHPLSTYMNSVIESGFQIQQYFEPRPSEKLVEQYPTLLRERKLPSSAIIVASK
jgi:SAM-dependent methyltransferase